MEERLRKIEHDIETLKRAHQANLDKIRSEQTNRGTADRQLYEGLKKEISGLQSEMVQGLKSIEQALGRIEAPPSREEAPVIRQIQESLADIEARLGTLETGYRNLWAERSRR